MLSHKRQPAGIRTLQTLLLLFITFVLASFLHLCVYIEPAGSSHGLIELKRLRHSAEQTPNSKQPKQPPPKPAQSVTDSHEVALVQHFKHIIKETGREAVPFDWVEFAADLVMYREDLRQRKRRRTTSSVADRVASGYPNVSGQGILMVAGPHHHWAQVYVTVKVLREGFNCHLPIEIVHFGAHEFDSKVAKAITAYAASPTGFGNVSFINGLAHFNDHRGSLPLHPSNTQVSGFLTKIYALIWVTSFQHVLYVDADNVPLMSPDHLFASSQYQTKGFLIWRDFWSNYKLVPDFLKMLGMGTSWQTDSNFRESESGQVMVDRSRHRDMLDWLWFLNSQKGCVYRNMLGDKDTFWVAFHLAGRVEDFQQVGSYSSSTVLQH